MKKTLLLALAASAAVGLNSCSSEEPLGNAGDGSGNITFRAQLPAGLATRAFNDGTSATQLSYYVYEENATEPVIAVTDATINLQTVIQLSLVNGKSYDVVFWAQSPDCEAYTYDPTARTVKVDYTGVAQNEEQRDAFYTVEHVTVTGGTTVDARLTRPFAQLNFGTADLDEPTVKAAFGDNLEKLTTSLAITTEVPDLLNLMDGTASGTATVSFTAAALPEDETFPYMPETYGYLAMNYLLADKESALVDLNFNILAEGETAPVNTLSVPNVPVQANYRTNIFGQLLTSTNVFNVIIEPAFNEPDYSYDLSAWSGDTATPPTDEISKTVIIRTPEELAGFAKMVNDGNDFYGYTVQLVNDLDLANRPWTPIGYLDPYASPSNSGGNGTTIFRGTFEGQGHTISNLYVNVEGEYVSAGLFGRASGVIRDLTITNFDINSTHYAGAVVGYFYTDVYYEYKVLTGEVTNCTVTNGTITTSPMLVNGEWDNGDKAGCLLGYLGAGNLNISNNTISNVVLTGYRDLGGLAGTVVDHQMNGSNSVAGSGNVISDVTIYQNLEHNYKNLAPLTNVGEVFGSFAPATGSTFPTATTSNVKLIAADLFINSLADVQAFAQAVNNSEESFANKTVLLCSDIDLSALAWTPVGSKDFPFKGTFDGQGHTISNMTVNMPEAVEGKGAGFFARLNGTVRNLNFSGASVTAVLSASAGDGAAVVAGTIYNTGLIENCTVNNSDVTSNRLAGGFAGYAYGTVRDCSLLNSKIVGNDPKQAGENDKVGGIIGYLGEGSYVISGNRVDGCYLLGERNVGGIIGCAQAGTTVKLNTVANTTINYTTALSALPSYANGEVVGRPISMTMTDNTVTNVTLERLQ